jgi:L-fuconate dehydratase
VCPHAGGLGLCEYVQHLSIIDDVCVSGSLADRTTEFADHLHEHFRHPALVRDGHYVVPDAPGYSVDLWPDSYAALTWPDGSAWQ